ncbi:hypothetical protein MARPO_0002s0130 [Marchantia polymorpha]|uniref:NAD(P)-binding domain-containing protein n=1 Tax=Marchantia polymorpha TaxID=3197 RepID=A0A2R6XU69_MARPO|nr:hypothetical protein MARPO_0002s0130 [Marchantia polymorpha]|eukprot:PTQ49654.1 hypothetical protein MARPO_0002s0130 [Marchantia polymorpha]
MDTHALASTRSCDLLPRSLVQCRVHDGRSVSIPSSLGKQWSFRVERRRLTLLSSRRRYSIDVRAKKSGPGSTKLKSKEPPAEEEDEQPVQRTKKQIKLPGTVKVPSKGGSRPKDNRTVFVAGATGNVGRRTVRELVKLGYKVRAGVRNVDTAQFLLEEEETKGESKDEEVEEPTKKGVWANFSPEKLFGFLGPKAKQAAQLVELVQCDLEKEDDIEEALGNAGVVICTIGASEKEVLDVTGPYRIDFKATKNLIDAASSAKVNHFILVTSLGTQKFGWPASVLNLFWGVLYWKAKAEKALIESGIPFTIVRPGGMEKPTDAYKETHNLRLFEADSMFGGQVSNLQVAELMASIVGNLNLARNKVLEAVAETTAPLRPTEDLLADISTFGAVKPAKRSDETRETKQAPKQRLQEYGSNSKEDTITYAEVLDSLFSVVTLVLTVVIVRSSSQEKQSQGAQAATDAAQKKTEAVRQKLQNEYESARLKEEEARQEAEAARAQKQEVERKAAELRSKLKAAAQAVREAKALETAVLAAARQGKQLSDRERKDIISSVRAEIEAEEKAVIAKEKAKQDAEKKARQEAEAKVKAKQDAEKKARQEAEAKATKLAAKLKAEAKAKADAEVAEKKRIESEAKAKKEEEKKMKIEAERKAKEEEEEKIRIEAEKKAKEEEEEKLRNEAEKKAKEEEEEKLRIEAEKKAKEEEEEKLRIEAEKKAKEEEEEKLRVEAEKKAKEEEEEKLRIEAERKAKEEEEEKGQADVRGEAESEAKPKGFRWPWQKDEPEGGAPTTSELGQDTAATEEAETTELPRPSRPLSPYTKFPTLKPPGPPTPPPGPQVQDLVTEGAAKETVEEPVTKEEEEVTPAVVAESSLETQAKRSGAFRWPWEKQDSEGEPTEEEVAAEPLTEETTAGDDPDLAPTINQTTKQEVAVPETTEELTRPSRPLSPYTAKKKVTVEAEKKAKEEEEEKLRIEAERKAKEEEEEKGQADVRGEAESEAKPKGFRWPWQKDEPEGGAPTTSELGQDTAATEEAETTELPRPSRPLSPYTKFPTLKPPGPPTPPPGPQVQDLVTEGAAKETVEEPVTKEEEEVTPAVVAESSLETQAKRSGAFRWPWEKQDSEGEPTEEEVAAEPLTEETTAGDDPDLAPTINQTTKQEVAVPETTEELTRPSRPLSPYTAYPALKPPTPPTPPKTIKPGEGESEAKLEASQVTPEPSVPVIEAQELTQDELNARAEEEERLKALAAQEAEAVAERERLAVERAKAAASFRWPWGQPEEASQENDVPSVDSVVEPAAETVIEVAGSAATESAESASIPELPQKSRPLSPYTMYPGMKPPRTPSPPKSPTKEPAEAARSEEPQSASAEAENGSATETVEDDGAQVLEPAGAFRWPWEQ